MAQDRNLVVQDEDLNVLGRGTVGEQPEPAEQLDREQIQQSEQHDSRSCYDHAVSLKPQITICVTSFGTVQGQHRRDPPTP
jgi:hypothetical protein